jgi:prefoldin alpha subunit
MSPLDVYAQFITDALTVSQTTLQNLNTEVEEINQTLAILDRLQSTSHPTPFMIPFSPLGFFPGHVDPLRRVHIHLGDNWYIEKTVVDAISYLQERKQTLLGRVAGCEEQVCGLETRKLVLATIQENDAVGGLELVEIREPVDEQVEKVVESVKVVEDKHWLSKEDKAFLRELELLEQELLAEEENDAYVSYGEEEEEGTSKRVRFARGESLEQVKLIESDTDTGTEDSEEDESPIAQHVVERQAMRPSQLLKEYEESRAKMVARYGDLSKASIEAETIVDKEEDDTPKVSRFKARQMARK